MDKYQEAMEALLRFRDERDWAQFHDSKNLALALLLEASELNELFLWKKRKRGRKSKPRTAGGGTGGRAGLCFAAG